METPTSSLESRNSTPDDDFNHCPITDISLTDFINEHKNHIEELLNYKPNPLEILVSSPMTTPNYYTRLGEPEENDELKECVRSLIGLSRQNQDGPSPLDTSSDILDNNSPDKTPLAPITKERKESMKSSPTTPTSPLPLIRQDACSPGGTDNNPDLYEVKRLMNDYHMSLEEAVNTINKSNREYEEQFDMGEEVTINTPPSDGEEYHLNRDEDQTDILEVDEDELDEIIGDYNSENIQDSNHLNNMEKKLNSLSEELYNRQLYLEQLSFELDEKLNNFDNKIDKNKQGGNFNFDVVLMVAFSWGVYKIVGMLWR